MMLIPIENAPDKILMVLIVSGDIYFL